MKHPWVTRYLAGETIRGIASSAGCDKEAVRKVLRENHTPMRPRGSPKGFFATFDRVPNEAQMQADAISGSGRLAAALQRYFERRGSV